MSYAEKTARLRALRAKVSSPIGKTEKSIYLAELRHIERELGFDVGNYNSSDFGKGI